VLDAAFNASWPSAWGSGGGVGAHPPATAETTSQTNGRGVRVQDGVDGMTGVVATHVPSEIDGIS
jgi:hypothetical protein